MSNLVRRSQSLLPDLANFQRDDFFRPFEQLFDDIFNQLDTRNWKSSLKASPGYPRMDVMTRDGKFVVELAIPGINPEDVHVEVEPAGAEASQAKNYGIDPEQFDVLHIYGKMEAAHEDAQFHVRELSRRAFKRSMALPKNLKGDPEAVFKNGLLTLSWEVENVLPAKPINRVIKIRAD
jgi:HSP20 family molecular chaperone IbpA